MANAALQLRTLGVGGGSIQYEYVIEGLETKQIRLSQIATPVPVPNATPTSTVLLNIVGQLQEITLSFVLLDRDDDYTSGYGSPSTYTPKEQRTYLLGTIFKPQGQHGFQDIDGTIYLGRITNLDFQEQGDDPLKINVSLSFQIGFVLGTNP